ncbi:oxidoreductase [Pseudomonas kairouanensis]|uniref:Oxidoreductase n=1 Tax=Pseudomonas kairouanensis TaxID=2293832 RepID=A0A4Z0AWQ9_9PSED|nr:FAD-dependent oxidoreductase [Pseudomonas kairouanensis]TFY91185.1 oxidoreductase [Pseudomonas kairouanensis]
MSAIQKALVVGGGIGGMASAISLARLGIEVDLVEIDPNWRVYGAGITITGPTLRAFQELGIYEEVKAIAYTGHGIRVCDISGKQLRELPTPMPADSNVCGSGGIMRPDLHRILSELTLSSGVNVQLGITVNSLDQALNHANVVFSDNRTEQYDLVIGADGINSKVRKLIFPHAPEVFFTGQNAWRLVAPRPSEIDCRHYFLGGPVKVGLSPVSDKHMYMFLLENSPSAKRFSESELHSRLRELLIPYGGVIGALREELSVESAIIMRPLQGLVLPAPWYLGRVLLIGDAAHPTTPQLASGAGMAVEDGIVLSEEIAKGDAIELALQRYMERRYPRCRLVVDNSLEIGRREQAGAPISAQTELVESTLRTLSEPA